MSDFDQKLGLILKQCVPGFKRLVSAERLSGGASQETYKITVEGAAGEQLLAMRRAAGGVTAETTPGYPGLPAEAKLMQAALAAGVPAPEIYHVLTDEDGIGDGFIMEWLQGETLGARIVKIPELADIRPKLAYMCGEALARIHSIDVKGSELSDILLPVTPKEIVEQTWQRYKDYQTPQPMIDFTARWLLENLPESYEPSLVHTDYRNGNIMISATGIDAVLDWELAHIGDPMRDLGWICVNSWRFGRSDLPVGGFGHYEDLFAGYESVSGVKVDRERVKFWEIFGSFWWAVACIGMAEHFRNGPDKTVERTVIGRRSSEGQIDCVNLLIPGEVQLVDGDSAENDSSMPRMDELLNGVKGFLRQEVMAQTTGRINFMSRVAANGVDIVLRELSLGAAAKQLEQGRLLALFNGSKNQSLQELQWQLVNGLRSGDVELSLPGLAEHLRLTTVNQVAIDQPKYSGLKTALA